MSSSGGSRFLKRWVPFSKGRVAASLKSLEDLKKPAMQHTCIRTCQNMIIHIILVTKMHCNLLNAMHGAMLAVVPAAL